LHAGREHQRERQPQVHDGDDADRDAVPVEAAQLEDGFNSASSSPLQRRGKWVTLTGSRRRART
jgi:hypothetical protein